MERARRKNTEMQLLGHWVDSAFVGGFAVFVDGKVKALNFADGEEVQ